MNFAERYFQKYSYKIPQIKEPPSGLLRFIAVIPAYLEDDIFNTLNSLKYADKPEDKLEVIVVVNFSEEDSKENKNKNLQIYKQLLDWCLLNSDNAIRFFSILADNLPKKHAGVGLARKIGMDEAVARFGLIDNANGIILSLDADAIVGANYFTSLEQILLSDDKIGAYIYQFAHDLEGQEYSKDIYNAVAEYELYLRYYKHILDYSGFPYSNYTIGSCFGVRADIYTSQGGMNRRQAGEDFYFLNKVFPNAKLIEITNSCISLSARPSARVPFGTGTAITKLSQQIEKVYETYIPQAFIDLKYLFDALDQLYENSSESEDDLLKTLAQPMREFLIEQKFYAKIAEIKRNTSSLNSFKKRFFTWFDGFKVVKYLNYAQSTYYRKIPVTDAVTIFFGKIDFSFNSSDVRSLLNLFRKLDGEGKKLWE